jgi:hypothetical protein
MFEGELWSAEEDVKWCANVALAAGGIVIFAGVIFAGYAESASVKCYTITASLIFGAMFLAVGAASHWWVRKSIERTTIGRLDGGQG